MGNSCTSLDGSIANIQKKQKYEQELLWFNCGKLFRLPVKNLLQKDRVLELEWNQMEPENILDKQIGSEFKLSVQINPSELFVITCFDEVFKVDLESAKITPLEKSGIAKGAFSIFCDWSYVYVFGGIDEKENKVKSCMKFNLHTEKWEKMADLNQARSSPGVLLSNDGLSIYVFGGRHNSFEIISIKDTSSPWAITNVKNFPFEHTYDNFGLTMYPLSRHKKAFDALAKQHILVFGGDTKEGFAIDQESLEEESKSGGGAKGAAATISLSIPTKFQIELQEPDSFYT